MRKIIQKASKHWQTLRIFLIALRWHIGIFVAMVFIFGCFYTYLTPCGHGIGQNLDPLPNITFPKNILTGIYFSTVTISSLGYGDMHPMGFSKVLACIEVILGLVLIGIMIAKVTSQSLSDRVKSLFSSDAQKRLEDIAEKLDISQRALNEIMPQFATVYQDTPGETSIDEDVESLTKHFQGIIREFQKACSILRDHFSEGINLDDYFQNVPASSVRRVGNAVDGAFSILRELPKYTTVV